MMIIITGTGRSGTSLIANLLLEIGQNLGSENSLRSEDKLNQKGYFENKEVSKLNIKLTIGEIVSDWIVDGVDNKIKKFISNILKVKYFFINKERIKRNSKKYKYEINEIYKSIKGVAVKDPRFSSTIGSWKQYVPIKKILYCYREPVEVAYSMKNAYQLPLKLGYIIWNRRIQQFFKQIYGINLVMVNYNNFFDEDKKIDEIKRLYNFANIEYSKEEANNILRKTIKTKLKHFSNNTKIPPKSCVKIHRSLNSYHTIYKELKPFKSDKL